MHYKINLFARCRAVKIGRRLGRVSVRRRILLIVALTTLRNLLNLCIPLTVFLFYESVRRSHSIYVFLAMFGTIVAVHVTQALFRFIRLRVIRRLAIDFEKTYRDPAYGLVFSQRAGRAKINLYIRDVDKVSVIINGDGFVALLDLPWVAVYLLIMSYVNFWLAVISAIFSIIIAATAFVDQRRQRLPPVIGSDAFFQWLSVESGLYRAFMSRSHFEKTCSNLRQEHNKKRWVKSFLEDSIRVISQAVKSIQIVVLLGATSYLTAEFRASIGTMMIIAFLAPKISDPLDTFIRNWSDIKAAYRSWCRIIATKSDDLVQAKLLDSNILPIMHVKDLVILKPVDNKAVILNISFTLKPGDVLILVGESGSGKTALANTLAGCWSPKAGLISFGGLNLVEIADETRTRMVGYLPQQIGFYFGSVAENISRFSSEIDDNALNEVLAHVGFDKQQCGLKSYVDAPIEQICHSLSPGARKNLAIARAFYGWPQYIVFDDPLAHLDEKSVENLKKLLKIHRQRGGISVLMVSNCRQLIDSDLIEDEKFMTRYGIGERKIIKLYELQLPVASVRS